MRIELLTIFPDLCEAVLNEGMLRKAREQGLAALQAVNLRTYAPDKHQVTDDYVFGGGPGMVLKPEPIFRAVEARTREHGRRPRVILTSPQGALFTQQRAWALAEEPYLLFICGRYEGVDERVREVLVDEELSIGDYVLTGGELPALVMTDAIVRLLPGVLNASEGAMEDSFSTGLLEGPHYTRPREFAGLTVPDVLLSGNHAAIARWRRKQALRRTLERRPELLAKAPLSELDRALLREIAQEKGAE